MEWIGEVEIAKSLGEVQTSTSVTGKTVRDFEILYSQLATGLGQILLGNFKRSVATEESEAQKKGGYLAGRQIAWLITRLAKSEATAQPFWTRAIY